MNRKAVASVDQGLAAQYLQQIANCLAYLVIHTGELRDKSNKDLIPILANLGFDRIATASILQTTPETVSVTLSQLKGKARARKDPSNSIEPPRPEGLTTNTRRAP